MLHVLFRRNQQGPLGSVTVAWWLKLCRPIVPNSARGVPEKLSKEPIVGIVIIVCTVVVERSSSSRGLLLLQQPSEPD